MEYKNLAQSDVNPVTRPLSLDECLRTRVHVRDCKTSCSVMLTLTTKTVVKMTSRWL